MAVAIDFARLAHFPVGMKQFLLIIALAGIVGFTPALARAQTNAAADKEKASVEKHIKPILSALKLSDPAKVARVHDILAAQFTALKGWHAAHDAQIKPLWNDFNHARSAHNVTNADLALDKIDGVYASFKPQHDKFIADLSTVLTLAQVETVKDVLTVNKVKVTYNVYLQIFPTLKDAQKAVVLKDLKDAREEAIDCESMKEKSAFFKKYKIKIEEDYLTAQGYDPKQARKDFAARQKAAAARSSSKE